MKVSNQNLSGLGPAGAGGAQQTPKSAGNVAGSSSGGAGTGDRVDFSSRLASLSRAMASFSSDGGAKVQALAKQYQSGTYSTDSTAISRGMISEALSR